MCGVYRDTLTRTAAGWRITERVFDIHFELGSREEVPGAQRSPAPQQSFSFTKILVNDLEAQFSFYSTVFGRTEKTRCDFDGRADPLAEIIMTSADGTDRSLVLLHYKNRPAPAPGSAVIGFEVSGIDAVVQRVADAGGTVTEPPRLMTNIGSRSPSSKIRKDTYWRSLNAFELRAGPAVTIRNEFGRCRPVASFFMRGRHLETGIDPDRFATHRIPTLSAQTMP